MNGIKKISGRLQPEKGGPEACSTFFPGTFAGTFRNNSLNRARFIRLPQLNLLRKLGKKFRRAVTFGVLSAEKKLHRPGFIAEPYLMRPGVEIKSLLFPHLAGGGAWRKNFNAYFGGLRKTGKVAQSLYPVRRRPGDIGNLNAVGGGDGALCNDSPSVSSLVSGLSAAAGFLLTQAAVSVAPSAAVSASQDRPNVLFIMVDDLRPAIGAYGDPVAVTPNMDDLAGRGRLFTHAYTQQAVCGPSRAATLTGLLPDRTRSWDNRTHVREHIPGLVTLPEHFKQHGYGTYSYGKVFHNHLFEDPQSWTVPNWGADPTWRRYAAPHNLTGRLKEDPVEKLEVVDEAYADGMIAARAIEALRHVPEPFFMAVGFHKPHLPFTAPKKYWDQYDRSGIPLPEGWMPPAARLGIEDAPPWLPPSVGPEKAPAIAFPRHRELVGYNGIPDDGRMSEEMVRELRHGYYACVTYVDTLIGGLLEALDERGVAENTIVLLWGDHGFHLGENHYWTKSTNFEMDTRIPLIIATPAMPRPGEPAEGLVETIDIYPTLVELAGLPPRHGLDGSSLVPLLEDPGASIRDHAISQFPRPWFYPRNRQPQEMGYSVRSPEFRYTAWLDFENREPGEVELYDYRNAGFVEARNVIDDPDYADIRRNMEALFERVLTERLGNEALRE